MSRGRVRQVGVALAVAGLSGAATVATASAAQAVTPPATRTVSVQVVPALAGVAFTLTGSPASPARVGRTPWSTPTSMAPPAASSSPTRH
jgi:hypothetical protein